MTTFSASTTRIDGGLIDGDLAAVALPRQVTVTDHALRALAAWLVTSGLLPADAVKARKAAIDIVTG
jgi:hypothetical protein